MAGVTVGMYNFSGSCHSKFHSPNAFCGNAGPEEMRHLYELLDELAEEEIKLLVRQVGIEFLVDEDRLTRDDYIAVLDEAGREDFYREYRKIIQGRKNVRAATPEVPT